MKRIIPLLFAAILVSAADAPLDKRGLPEITKKHHESLDASGKVTCYGDTFYRGGKRILVQAVYTGPTQSGIKMWREYFVDDQTVVREMDYGTNKPAMVWIWREGSLHEAFRRNADGSVEPISSQELAKVKGETEAILTGFGRVMKEVSARTETNSVEKVMGDLKTEVEQYKQKQRPGGDPK